MNIINHLFVITTILFLSTKSSALPSKLINDCNIYKNQTIYFNTAKVLAYSNNYNQLIRNIVLDEQSCIITIDFKTIDLYYSLFNRDYYRFNDNNKRINISEYMTIVGGQNTKSVYGYIYSYISIISSNETTLNNYMTYSSNNDVESTTSSSSNISLNFGVYCYYLIISFIVLNMF